jgi:hypothetical protein
MRVDRRDLNKIPTQTQQIVCKMNSLDLMCKQYLTSIHRINQTSSKAHERYDHPQVGMTINILLHVVAY